MAENNNIVIIILNRNNINGLRECINSLTSQTFGYFNILVIDGNSSDGSIELLQSFKKNYNNFDFIVQKSKGTGSARNEALEYSFKKWCPVELVIWGDSENIYHKKYIENILSFYTQQNFDIIAGRSIVKSSSVIGQSFYWYHTPSILNWKGKGAPGNNVAVKAPIYNSFRYPNLIRGDDFYFHEILKHQNAKFGYCDSAICYVNVPKDIRSFLKWEKWRVKGCLQGSAETGITTFRKSIVTYLLVALSAIFALFFLLYWPPVSLIYIAIVFIFALVVYNSSKHFVYNPRKLMYFVELPILLFHVFTSLYYLLLFYKEHGDKNK